MHLTAEELSRLDERFDVVVREATSLGFWTGLLPVLAKQWADNHKLKTLTSAMGSLYSDNGPESPKHGKSPKAWPKCMKGASALFALHACWDRRAVVLTKQPPKIYSRRAQSNYRDIKEPILTGLKGEYHTLHIDYVHPEVPGAAAFQYQVSPLDKPVEWLTFIDTLSTRNLGTTPIGSITALGRESGGPIQAQDVRVLTMGTATLWKEVRPVTRPDGHLTNPRLYSTDLAIYEDAANIESCLKGTVNIQGESVNHENDRYRWLRAGYQSRW